MGRAPPWRAWIASLVLVSVLALSAAVLAQPATPPAAAPVRVGEAVVLQLSDAGGRTAKDRAARASQAIGSVIDRPELGAPRVELSADRANLFVGDTLLVELLPADAALAGEPALETYANQRAGALRQALDSERKRSRIAGTVFAWSLVVFLGLMAFFLIKRVASLSDRARSWLDEHGDETFAVSFKSIELVRPAVVKSSAVIALGLAKWLGQFGIFYAWLLVVLSLFETTRGYTEKLTGFVISPLSLLLGRSLAAVPVLVVAGFAALAVFVLVRFVGLFLASVARRETQLGWLPADLASPASVLLRFAIVVGALVFAAPVVTGSADDSLGRTGTVVLWALGIAATPLLATGLFGATLLFDRRLGVGDHVRIRGEIGRVVGINLLETRLLTSAGSEQRVPHLLLLVSPLERLGPTPRVSVELCAPRELSADAVLGALAAAGNRRGAAALAEIVEVGPHSVSYRLTATLASISERSALLGAALEAVRTLPAARTATDAGAAESGVAPGGTPASLARRE